MKKTHPKYRIIRSTLEDGDNNHPPSYIFTIREVFHNTHGNITNYSEEYLPSGSSKWDLQEDLLKMLNALIYPTLDEDCQEIKDDT